LVVVDEDIEDRLGDVGAAMRVSKKTGREEERTN
jgi:hypothetical protein